MSDDILKTMAAGMTGRFWWLLNGVPQQPPTNGHIHRDEDGYWVVEVEGWRSMENVTKSEDENYPDSMMGVLGKRHRLPVRPTAADRLLVVVRSADPCRPLDVRNRCYRP